MNLIQIKNNTYYFDNPSVIGLYRLNDTDVLLIDTGLDDDAARKVLRIIDERNWKIKAVINTHSHADHCGGNHFIQKRTDALFYATAFEKSYIETPSSEPHYLFGSYPPKIMRAKFLQANPSIINRLIERDNMIIEGVDFKIIDLKGHSPGHIGIITQDDVFFVGDAVIESKIVEKYKFLYNYSLRDLLEALNKVLEINAEYYVLSHGGVKRTIKDDIEINMIAINSLNEFILGMLNKEYNKNDIHREMTKYFGIEETISNYYLNDSLLSSHLAYLIEENMIEFYVSSGEIFYKKQPLG
ncbi:MAG: MBL fold metallo-hydrolase [Clostridiales bacterium]|nr:MBL fold metallo-hydrolase [Clostridiales bacterium]